ncbi:MULTISPECIES: hypothetical protein [unclassified Blastococcus]
MVVDGVGRAGGLDRRRAGLDVEVDGLRTQVTMLDEHVARVDVVGGRLTWRVAADEVDGGLRRTLAEEGAEIESGEGTVDLTQPVDVDGEEFPPFVMVVDNGEGWYVSPLFTAAEQLVRSQGLPPGDFSRLGGDVPSGVGGRSPEDAVQTLVTTLGTEGLVPAVRQAADQAGGVFAVYQDAIVEVLRDEVDVDGFWADLDVSTRVADLGDGRAAVSLVSVYGYTSEGDDVEFDATCPTEDADECFEEEGELLSVRDLHVVVVQRDGSWVIDPLGTLWHYAGTAIEGVDEEAALEYLRDW